MKKRTEKPRFKRIIITEDTSKLDKIENNVIFPNTAISIGKISTCELTVTDTESMTIFIVLNLQLFERNEFILELKTIIPRIDKKEKITPMLNR